MRASVSHRALRFLRREAWVIFIGWLALVTRLFWNLVVHPPRNFIFSDMASYFARADDFIKQPLSYTADHLSFYPWGTHAFMGLVKQAFTTPTSCPRDVSGISAAAGCWPIDASFAVVGAAGVLYTTLLARRLTNRGPNAGKRRFIYIVTGLVMVFYYPLVAMGGFYVSEVPFFLCVTAATYHGLRLADEGKVSDALLFGVFTALGAVVRAQMLMSLALLGLFWLFRRRQLPGATLKNLAIAGAPLVLILTFSAIRTTRHIRTFNKHESALISTNDALNYAFGRCHMIAVEARQKGYAAFFGPPGLGAVFFAARDRKKKKQWVPIEIRATMAADPRCEVNKKHAEKKEEGEPCLYVEGRMWSRDIFNKAARDCVAKSGPGRQLYYSATHLVLNYGLNFTWPDSGQPLREAEHLGIKFSTGKPVIEKWQIAFGAAIVPFALIASFLGFRKRNSRDGLVTMHIWAVNLVAAIYFGETRLRTPYDGLFIVLGLDLLARIVTWTGKKTAGMLAR